MLWIVFSILIALWLFGLFAGLGGNLVHILLVLAVIVLVINLLNRRHTTA